MSKAEQVIRFIILPALSFCFLAYSIYATLRKGPVKEDDEPGKFRDYYEEQGKWLRRLFYGLFPKRR
ncbi:hypothetical protein [Mucilaginibacter sp. CSA2-8R]|uniref:hypothetical protein n=1 Tax=Mucilaginibacter sp. CSA2-8R TaxID=3141542 RepID=UPI00315DACB7